VPESQLAIRELTRAGPEGIRPETAGEPAEHAGFEDFFRSDYRALVRWIRFGSAADQAMAEDVAQETMLITYMHWERIDQPQHYAFRVASRLASRAISRERMLRGAEESLALAETSSVGIPEYAGVRYDVERTIRSLPLRQRQIAVLRWMLDWRSPEIAAFLGISPSSVRSHLHAARDRLARALEADPQPAQGGAAAAAEVAGLPERSIEYP
jgi:RNA polymerase sigma factor (sigma-70 family)